jgi:4-aminobutyrate aminotransferase-like enzyme
VLLDRIHIFFPTFGTMRTSALRLAKDYLGVLEQRFAPAVARAPKGNNIVVDYAKGCWLTDVNGGKWLDFQSGIGVANTGHCHPR